MECLRRAGNQVDAEVKIENRLHPPYPYRVDYVINDEIAVEIQGVGFSHGGRKGQARDVAKAQVIASKGWLYCPVTRQDVKDGEALEALHRCGVRVTP